MDTKIAEVIAALKASGYTDRFVPEHWNDNWRDKRWFSFEDPTETILQIITGNVYTRVVAVGEGEPFVCLQYLSVEHPHRPKTDFFRDQSLTTTATRKNIREVLAMIPGLEEDEAREAA